MYKMSANLAMRSETLSGATPSYSSSSVIEACQVPQVEMHVPVLCCTKKMYVLFQSIRFPNIQNELCINLGLPGK